jgi:hypothetical protein
VNMRLRGYPLRNLVMLQGLLAITIPVYLSSCADLSGMTFLCGAQTMIAAPPCSGSADLRYGRAALRSLLRRWFRNLLPRWRDFALWTFIYTVRSHYFIFAAESPVAWRAGEFSANRAVSSPKRMPKKPPRVAPGFAPLHPVSPVSASCCGDGFRLAAAAFAVETRCAFEVHHLAFLPPPLSDPAGLAEYATPWGGFEPYRRSLPPLRAVVGSLAAMLFSLRVAIPLWRRFVDQKLSKSVFEAREGHWRQALANTRSHSNWGCNWSFTASRNSVHAVPGLTLETGSDSEAARAG